MVIEDKSFIENSIFRIILRSGNECNIDCASDSKIVLDKYNEIFKQKMYYDYIFVDLSYQNSLKILPIIREEETKARIHTNIVGIYINQNDLNMFNNKEKEKALFDKFIEKSIKEFNELLN